MEPAAPQEDSARASAGRRIPPCPSCGRAVSIYGWMRRIPCAYGEILKDVGREPGPT